MGRTYRKGFIMTDVDKSTSSSNDRIVPVNYGEHGSGITLSRFVLFSDYAASGDVVNLIAVPANSFVSRMYAVVEEAFDGTPVLTVGDDNTSNGYFADGDIAETAVNTVADLNAPDNTGAFALKGARPQYTSADTIDVTFAWSTTPTVGRLELIVELVTIP